MEAPKSSKALANVISPMVHGTEKVPGSSHFCGRLDWDSDETVWICFFFKFLL
ncbi:hypothetical protein Fmac_001526 [Flemingia macrophylla]|uniref:Uncharacterized protein n=1 Tax=Flemingia macrophylla TaxID=520843 RepID=A0ABD1NHH1_9FABA